jgi:hypothetical protein
VHQKHAYVLRKGNKCVLDSRKVHDVCEDEKTREEKVLGV